MVRSVRDEIPVVVITGGDDRVAASIIVPVVVVNQVFAATSFGILFRFKLSGRPVVRA
jgi:hypothetical protein